jgi:hypothetical protein
VAVLDVRLPDGGPPPGTGIRAGENGPRAAGDPGGHSGEPPF